MEDELTVANQNLIDMSETIEVVFHTLDHHHRLTTVIDGERLILDTFGGNLDLRQLAYLREHGVVGSHRLTLHGFYLQLGVEGGEEGSHEIMETVEHTERDHKGHRGNGHPYDRDGTDDIDGVSRFLGEKVAPCNEKRKVHFFKSSSICSI